MPVIWGWEKIYKTDDNQFFSAFLIFSTDTVLQEKKRILILKDEKTDW